MRNKDKVEVYFTKDAKERLKARADSLGVGMATVIKLALEEYLKK